MPAAAITACTARLSSRQALQAAQWRQRQCRQAGRRQRQASRDKTVSAKMYVPTADSFGGQSPERRAAQSLQTFFTFVAARIVLSQLEGIGRGDLGAYNAEGCATLRHFLQQEDMRDCNAWLTKLMQKDELLGVRIMEVRKAYANEDFEWHNLKSLALEGLEAQNTQLLREHASQRFGAMLQQTGGSGSGGEAGGQPEP